MNDAIAALPGTLPGLIKQAMAALSTATTAAEVLDAKDKAHVAYTAAKAALRFSTAKGAHDTVVAACRKAMGDALLIEKTAQCRLADEYDAAQARGEVAKRGGSGNNQHGNITNENISSTVEDIGLTSKQVHEARAVRDAEKEQPGLISQTIEDKLKTGKEPTRADIKRALKGGRSAKAPRHERAPNEKQIQVSINADPGAWERFKAVSGSEGLSAAAKLGEVLLASMSEAPPVSVSTLSLTAQKKFDLLEKRLRAELEAAFEERVRAEVEKRLAYRDARDVERIEQANTILSRGGKKPFTAQEYTGVLMRALHPDTSTDEARLEAFKLVNNKKFLLREDGRIVTLSSQAAPLPRSAAEWAAAKQAAAARKRAKRDAHA